MDDWQTITLEAGLERLIDYRGKSPPKSLFGVPVISAKVVKNGRINQFIEQKIDPNYYYVWMTRGLPSIGDIVMTTEGPMGEVAQLDQESVKFALGQRVVCMRGKLGVLDNTFLRFLLGSPIQQGILSSFATGTTVEGISQKALRAIPIRIPPYPEQIAIGEVLGALDDKIDLNRRMNETLETMARAIFKDWFEDFGPTRAKIEGRATYLSPDVWALFPDRLDDHDKPDGWTHAKIGDFCTVVQGRSYSSVDLQELDTALVTLKSFARGGGYRRDGLKAYTGSYKPEQLISQGEIVVAQTDVTQAAEIIGRPARVISDGRYQRLVASLDVAIVRPSKAGPLNPEFLYSLMAHDAFVQHNIARSSGTTGMTSCKGSHTVI